MFCQDVSNRELQEVFTKGAEVVLAVCNNVMDRTGDLRGNSPGDEFTEQVSVPSRLKGSSTSTSSPSASSRASWSLSTGCSSSTLLATAISPLSATQFPNAPPVFVLVSFTWMILFHAYNCRHLRASTSFTTQGGDPGRFLASYGERASRWCKVCRLMSRKYRLKIRTSGPSRSKWLECFGGTRI